MANVPLPGTVMEAHNVERAHSQQYDSGHGRVERI